MNVVTNIPILLLGVMIMLIAQAANVDETTTLIFMFLIFFGALIISAFALPDGDYWKDFDTYKKQTVKRVVALGGNPEDLDKEETA